MQSFIFGKSSEGLPIPAFVFGQGPYHVLVLGGVHGDETEGTTAAWGLYEKLHQAFDYQLKVTLVPMLNIDGVIHKTRQNARGIDLNRNMATKDWSPEIKGPRYQPGPAPNIEPETQALAAFVDQQKPHLIVSLHSWHPVLNVNGACESEAQVLSQWTGYKVDTDIGYPTPGCLGTYAGLERQSPTITYEIERGQKTPEILKMHVPALLELFKSLEGKSK
ncbi:MAG: M14 family zinc carboxypeptidase [Pseudobdellovibrionaceae bacterium]